MERCRQIFMQFQKNKQFALCQISILLTLVTIFSFDLLAKQKLKSGHVAGTISYGNTKTRRTITTSPSTIISLIHKGKSNSITSNESGDYLIKLPVGKYCITWVKNSDGEKLKMRVNQAKCFMIKKDNTTRFDIDLIDN